ncbi:MAG: hypothetical protein J5654_09965 [Victivallales bacterium]|nr:hypothetical protein [Victivallales bacterium]
MARLAGRDCGDQLHPRPQSRTSGLEGGGVPRGNASTAQQPPCVAAINFSEYYQTFAFTRSCSSATGPAGGTLPPCAIMVSRQAQINQDPVVFVPKRTIVNSITYSALCFNLAKCAPMKPSMRPTWRNSSTP